METLTDTLFSLLYDSQFRERFVSDRLFEREEFRDFSTVDWRQLNLFGTSIERNLFAEGLVASKSLGEIFPKSMAELENAKIDFRRHFPFSPEFSAYSDLNHCDHFLSLEEAFFRYVAREVPAAEPIARREFLTIHFQNLALHLNPAFSTNPDFARPIEGGYASIQKIGDEILLFAALSGKFISGPVARETAEVFRAYFLDDQFPVKEKDLELVTGLEDLGFTRSAGQPLEEKISPLKET